MITKIYQYYECMKTFIRVFTIFVIICLMKQLVQANQCIQNYDGNLFIIEPLKIPKVNWIKNQTLKSTFKKIDNLIKDIRLKEGDFDSNIVKNVTDLIVKTSPHGYSFLPELIDAVSTRPVLKISKGTYFIRNNAYYLIENFKNELEVKQFILSLIYRQILKVSDLSVIDQLASFFYQSGGAQIGPIIDHAVSVIKDNKNKSSIDIQRALIVLRNLARGPMVRMNSKNLKLDIDNEFLSYQKYFNTYFSYADLSESASLSIKQESEIYDAVKNIDTSWLPKTVSTDVFV